MSKSWSARMGVDGGAVVQSAAVMPLQIVTMDVQIEWRVVSETGLWVMRGIVERRTASAVIVAWRHGAMLLVMMGKEYFATMGFDRAVSDDERAPEL